MYHALALAALSLVPVLALALTPVLTQELVPILVRVLVLVPVPRTCASTGTSTSTFYLFLLFFTDFSDFLGRLHPRRTRLQKPPNTLGVKESSSPRRVLHF